MRFRGGKRAFFDAPRGKRKRGCSPRDVGVVAVEEAAVVRRLQAIDDCEQTGHGFGGLSVAFAPPMPVRTQPGLTATTIMPRSPSTIESRRLAMFSAALLIA